MASIAHRLTRRLTRGDSKRLDTTWPFTSSGAATLLGSETSGWAADFTDMTIEVRDPITPANNYIGTPAAWLTYTSPSTKWIVGQDGLLASGTTIRTEYSGTTPLGVRIDEARTNLCLWSDDLTNAVWTKTNATTAATATGPDGAANSATTVTATAGNATVLQSITSASAARFTDCYIKRRTGSGTIEMTQNGGVAWAAVTVTSTWTRVSIASATVTNPQVGLRIVTSGDAVDVAFFNCQSGGSQSSPIRTTSATVTRAGDIITADVSKFALSQTAASIVGHAYHDGTAGVRNVAELSATVRADTLLQFYYSGTTTVTLAVYAAAFAGQANISRIISATPAFHKLAARAANNNFQICVDGALGVADTAGTFPANPLTRFYLGSNNGGGQILNGWLKSIEYLPRVLSDAEMQAATL